MLRFEIKKIFSRTRNRVAVAFLLVVLVVVSMLTVNMVEYTDENGESILKSCTDVENDHLLLLDANGKREEQSIKDLLLKGVVVGVQRAL